jgi:hypothetical protein
MRHLLVTLALFASTTSVADAQTNDAAPPAAQPPQTLLGPFSEQWALRTDSAIRVQSSVAPNYVIMTAGVRRARTAQLATDLQLRGGAFGLGRRPPPLPAGIGLYFLDDLQSSTFAMAGPHISAWCAPPWMDAQGAQQAPFCLVFRDGAMASHDVQMLPPMMDNPLLVQGVNLTAGGSWGPRPQLEETEVILPGETTASVLFAGVHGANLALQVTITAHLNGYPDAILIFTKEAPILRDGSAYFDFGGHSDMQLVPIAGSENFAVRFHGPFAAWLAAHSAQ